MRSVVLRGGVEVERPLELVLEFLAAYPGAAAYDSSGSPLFDEGALRLANRGGARISAAEIAAVLERCGEIDRALGTIHPDASLADGANAIPWESLTELFEAFAGIRGIGLSKMTKALHPTRPALIPMLDSVVQAYLARDGPGTSASACLPRSCSTCAGCRPLRSPPAGAEAAALVRSLKQDVDRNAAALRELRRALAVCEHRLTEVRILDVLIWSTGT